MLMLRQPGEFVERRDPRPDRAHPRYRGSLAAASGASPAAGKICDRVGAELAASGAAFDRWRAVSGGVLVRTVAGAAVAGARHRASAVCGAGAGRAVSAA